MQSEITREAKLTKGNVGKTLFKLTVPMFFGIVGMVAFNIVDTYFVGRLGTKYLAAMSYTLPVVFFIGSIALGVGIGASALISRAIGQGNNEKVRRLATDSLILGLLIVLVFIIIGLLTVKPLFTLMGADKDVLPLIKDYMYIWYPGMLFVVVPMVGNNVIRGTGDMKIPGIIMLIASGLNVILDPLLIFGIWIFPRMELGGAALATVLSRAITIVFALYVLIKRENLIDFKIIKFKELISSFKKILFIGIPAAFTRIVLPLSVGIVTRILSPYGKEVVAAFGVCLRIEFFTLTIPLSLATVINPFVGQNWTSGNFKRVFKGIKLSTGFSVFFGIFIFIVLFFLGKLIAPLFNDNEIVINTMGLYFKIVPFAYGLRGVHMISGTALYSLHKPVYTAILTFIQLFVFYVPLAWLGSHLFKITGVFLGIAIANVFAGILSYSVLRKVLINLKTMHS